MTGARSEWNGHFSVPRFCSLIGKVRVYLSLQYSSVFIFRSGAASCILRFDAPL